MSAARRSARQSDELPRAHGDALRRAVRAFYSRAAAPVVAVARGRKPVGCAPHSGLGCGNATALAGLAPGESVLDLGSGAGFDCLAAAVEVGSRGRVVGVDMTPDMVRLARRHAADAGVAIASFLQAEIECLPFRDATFDVVMSNCVVNLCADKRRVLAEACRVLRPGGRLAMADIVAVAPLPPGILTDLALRTGCIAGAVPPETLAWMLREAGFGSVEIATGDHSGALIEAWAPGANLERFVAAASGTARK